MIQKRYKLINLQVNTNGDCRFVALNNKEDYETIIKQAVEFYNLLNLTASIKLILENIELYIDKNKSKVDLIREFEHEYFLTTGIMVE